MEINSYLPEDESKGVERSVLMVSAVADPLGSSDSLRHSEHPFYVGVIRNKLDSIFQLPTTMWP